jgi:hypothetical protein
MLTARLHPDPGIIAPPRIPHHRTSISAIDSYLPPTFVAVRGAHRAGRHRQGDACLRHRQVQLHHPHALRPLCRSIR